jgi:hypothetical protein
MSWLAIAGLVVVGVLSFVIIVSVVLLCVAGMEVIELAEIKLVDHEGVSFSVRVMAEVGALSKLREHKQMDFVVKYKHLALKCLAEQRIKEGYHLEIGHLMGDTFRARMVKHG